MKPRTVQILSISLFVLLILWGGYTFIYYLGVPYHGATLVPDETMTAISGYCNADAYVCRGLATIGPALWNTIVRAGPFLWYAILSLVTFAGVAAWKFFGKGERTMTIRWSPWKIAALSIASLWLLSTVLSFGTFKGAPARIYVEPTAETYNVSESALASLQQDYHEMLDRGCLATYAQNNSGAKIYMMRTWCIETAFVTRTLTQVIFVGVLLLEFLIVGRFLLGLILLRRSQRKDTRWSGCPTALSEALLSAGLGACGIIVLLWLAAIAGVYTAAMGWILAIAIPVIGYRHAIHWGKQFLFHTWETEQGWRDATLLLGWLLVTYVMLNFLEVVRPFPIGWDDLGSYLNRPRLLVSYGSFIAPMSPFDWTYLTSLGFLLFGYNAPFGSTASMMVNWSSGLLATLGVYAFARTYLGKKSGLLSALLYYTLPLVGHFSFADMKIDNAIFFFSTMGVFVLLLTFAPPDHEEAPMTHVASHVRRMVLAGLLLGFAFATKVTSIMYIAAAGAMLVGMMTVPIGFVGAVLLSCVVFMEQHALSFNDIFLRITGGAPGRLAGIFLMMTCAVIGLACVAYPLVRKRSALRPLLITIAAFLVGLCVAILPWIAHNNIEAGNIIPQFQLSAPNSLSANADIYELPAELKVNAEAPECKPSGAREELDRYWGFSEGWSHYLTLPWRTVMNLDSTGYYVTTFAALLLAPLVLLLPFFWEKKARWLRWLMLGTAFMLFEWMFMANGVPWYGVGMFLGLSVALETLVKRSPDAPTRIAASVLVACSLIGAFGMRLWQFEQQRNIFEYSMGKISSDSMREITIPWYDAISATVVQRHEMLPDRPYLYRIGTFIAYFIPRNLEIIGMSDHQLDSFNCLYQERDPQLTVKRLKALGFNSIIFDTNTATIERDEQGSLHKKVNAFVDFVNNPKAGLQVVVSDTGAGVAYILIP